MLFYGIAVYEGYRFAFRRVSIEELSKFKSAEYEGHPSNYKLRMPLFIGSIIILVFFFFKINKGVNGLKTFQYESGKKMSEGEMKNSKEHGEWTFWYENGNVQSSGFYSNGLPDSLWQWFNETGKLLRIGHYKNGLEHGIWENFYNNGTLSDSGRYFEGRMNGLWKYWHENGILNQSGYFKRNLQDSIWKIYYENGQLNTEGEMVDGNLTGIWTTYYENGQLASHIVHKPNIEMIIENVWDIKGKQIVINGDGYFKSYSGTGIVILMGKVEKGKRVEKWITYYENGKQKEEGKYKNEMYYILNSWGLNGNQNVINGTGTYITYYSDEESVFETGEVINGLREGIWKLYYESIGIVYQEQNYIKGKLTGLQKIYFESGQLYSSGEMTDGLREGEWKWYNENGSISSIAIFDKDKKEGKQIMWSEVGEKTKEEYYENGELIEEKIF